MNYKQNNEDTRKSEGADSAERIIATGRIFELVQLDQPNGAIFEVARRAPGLRLIITDNDKKRILLTREFRRELNAYDYRLPGGKVFDTLAEFVKFRESGLAIKGAVEEKARQEGAEEAGVVIDEMSIIGKSTLGTTVEWDLYIVFADRWHFAEEGQMLEVGEDISADDWFTYGEAYNLALTGSMSEERVALLLMRWLDSQKGDAS